MLTPSLLNLVQFFLNDRTNLIQLASREAMIRKQFAGPRNREESPIAP